MRPAFHAARAVALAAAGLTALAACDTDGLDPLPPAPTVVDTLGTFHLPARATYLRVNADPDAVDAVPLDLDALGVRAGDTLSFWVTGLAVIDPTTATRTHNVVGVFSADGALAPSDSLRRVTGAVEAGADFVTLPTGVGGLPTDVPEDFFATRSSVVVPGGARRLFLAVHDGYYSDNENLGAGVQLTLLRR